MKEKGLLLKLLAWRWRIAMHHRASLFFFYSTFLAPPKKFLDLPVSRYGKNLKRKQKFHLLNLLMEVRIFYVENALKLVYVHLLPEKKIYAR